MRLHNEAESKENSRNHSGRTGRRGSFYELSKKNKARSKGWKWTTKDFWVFFFFGRGKREKNDFAQGAGKGTKKLGRVPVKRKWKTETTLFRGGDNASFRYK